MKERLGSEIRLLRKQAGMTQKELANILGLSEMTVVSVETGKKNVGIDNYVSVLDYFNATLQIKIEK